MKNRSKPFGLEGQDHLRSSYLALATVDDMRPCIPDLAVTPVVDPNPCFGPRVNGGGEGQALIIERAEPVEDDYYLAAPRVRRRYGGISDMTLWRWLQDERMDFPIPIVINSRRYWKASELAKWEADQRQ